MINRELAKQGYKMKAMEKWCELMEISFTPTIFINGYQLPGAYSIEDLQYFLLPLQGVLHLQITDE